MKGCLKVRLECKKIKMFEDTVWLIIIKIAEELKRVEDKVQIQAQCAKNPT